MSFCKDDMYDFGGCVQRPRTWGHGIHLIYDKDRRKRKHARRFLNWHMSRNGYKNVYVEEIGAGNLSMFVPGEIHLSGYERQILIGHACFVRKIVAKTLMEENGFNTKFWYLGKGMFDMVPLLFQGKTQHSDKMLCHLLGVYNTGPFFKDFYRDGVPNNYDESAKEYDRMCMEKSRCAYEYTHRTSRIKELAMDDVRRSVSEYEFLDATRCYFSLSQGERKLWEYYPWRKKDLPRLRLLFVDCWKSYVNRFRNDVVKRCNKSMRNSSHNVSQLRALGFVA